VFSLAGFVSGSLALLVLASSAAAAPANDSFGKAVDLRVGQTVPGTVNGATKQRGEPQHANSLATHSVWYRFRAKRKVALGLNTCDSNFDTVLAVYTGRRLRSLRPVEFNNDGGCGDGSRVTFTARPGKTYRIAVVGFSGSGRFQLRVRSVNTPPNDDFADAAPLTLGSSVNGTTRNATRELNEPRHDRKSADQTVWFRLRVPAAGMVEVNTCQRDFDTVLAVYTGRRVDRLTRVTSNDDACGLGSRVTFAAEPGRTYRIALAEYSRGSGRYRLVARSAGAPASAAAAPGNDAFGSAVDLRVGRTVAGTVNGATKQRGEPQHANSLATHSVWYRFRAKRKVALGLDTCDSNFDTVLAVYTGRHLRSLRTIEFNNDGGCAGGSRVTFTARRGKTYRIAVAGFSASGRFRLKVRSVATPPNDDFVDAAAITLGTPLNGTTRNATRELGEPRHSNGNPRTIWFRLRVAAPTTVELSACSGGFATLTVYTRRRLSNLTRVDGEGCSVRFAAQAGTTYRIVAETCCRGGPVRVTSRAVP
jgi:hypothetical protein